MNKSLLFLLLFCIPSFTLLAQNNEIEAKASFLLAEENYLAGKYKTALGYLENAEKQLGVTNCKLLYLKISIESEIYKTNPDYYSKLMNSIEQFQSHPSITSFTQEKVLEIAKLKIELQDNYAKILENKKIKEERQRVEREKQRTEELNRIAREKIIQQENELKRQQKLNNSGYFSFTVAYSLPLSSKSKESIQYNAWQGISDNPLMDGVSENPFTIASKSGKMGLSSGITFGFEGIGVPKKTRTKMKKSNFGIAYEVKQSFLFYNFKNVKGVPFDSTDYENYFYNILKTPFMITNFAIGPALSLRVGKEKTFIDLYCKANLNLIYGGSYFSSAEIYTNANGYSSYNTVVMSGENVNLIKLSVSPSFGVNFRWKSLLLGVGVRPGLKSHKLIKDYYRVSDSYYNINSSNTIKTKGIVINHLNFKLGVIFKGK